MENPPVEETLKYRVYKFFDHFVDFGEAVLAFPLLQWTLYLVSQESYWTLGRPPVCIAPRDLEGKWRRNANGRTSKIPIRLLGHQIERQL